jgi:hypothetical protein
MTKKKDNSLTFNIDFDGTCVTHEFPDIGSDIGAVPVLKKLVEKGHKLILFTMRSDGVPFKKKDGSVDVRGLSDALDWFVTNGIPLYGIQTNPSQRSWTTSPKSHANIMIDDSALGCPLKVDLSISSTPFVDWVIVEEILTQRGII